MLVEERHLNRILTVIMVFSALTALIAPLYDTVRVCMQEDKHAACFSALCT